MVATPRDTLSKLVIFEKYANRIESEKRRENPDEIAYRMEDMYLTHPRFQAHKDLTNEIMDAVRRGDILPSMRAMQFAGEPMVTNPAKGYNCSYLHATSPEALAEVMYLLLAGSGVGYSVQLHHVKKFPKIKGPDLAHESRRFRIHDQIEGWADAVLALVKSYTDGTRTIRFDYSDIRGSDKIIKSSGRKAPGHARLEETLEKIRGILDQAVGRKLKSLEIHDICCWIAWCVVAGGVRRSAMIALFSLEDRAMMNCKANDWYIANPQRGRANNSAVLVRGQVSEKKFRKLMKAVERNRTGEPGLFWTNDREIGTNPCGEIALRDMQFCNLTSINFSTVRDEADFLNRVRLATALGTYQATFTDFIYLRDAWVDNCKEEALLGVSITGMCENEELLYSIDFEKAARMALETNAQLALALGINPAARILTVKPEGTGTLAVKAVAAGVHRPPANQWIKHYTLNVDSDLYRFLSQKMPSYIVPSPYTPHEAYLAFPLALPPSCTKTELNTDAMDTLERIKYIYNEWVVRGHRTGANTHNVSSTVRVRDDEWEGVTDWMWDNRDKYAAISFLHIQDTSAWPILPQQPISIEQYDVMVNGGEYNGHVYEGWQDIDFDELKEENNNVDLNAELACAGGACLI